jgi:hypothetical protein
LLVRAVWKSSSPVDWSVEAADRSCALQELDAWLLQKSKCDVALGSLYQDLQSACLSRIAVARDKAKKVKKRKADSIGSVAESIAKAVGPQVESRNVPEDLSDGAELDIRFNFDRKNLRRIATEQLLDRYDIRVVTKGGDAAYEGGFVQPVAEVLIRSLLWGRSTFSISSDRPTMMNTVTRFIEWFASIDFEIDRLIAESALGTGYEASLRTEVYARLKVHPMAGAKVLPSEIVL